MTKLNLIFQGILFVSLIACKSAPPEESSNETSQTSPVSEIIETPHDLKLNGTEKWTIAEEMRTYIDSIDYTLADFSGNDSAAYAQLSTDLARQTKAVISNCTMQGEAHDELHKWLLPFIDLRKTLNPMAENEAKEKKVAELRAEMNNFHTYFN